MSAPTMTHAFSFGSIQRVHCQCYTALSHENTVVSWAILGSPFCKWLTANSFRCNQVTMLVVVVQKAHWKKHCSTLLSCENSRTPPCHREILHKARNSVCFQVKHWIIQMSLFSSSIPSPSQMLTTSSAYDWSDSFQLHQGAEYKPRHHSCLVVERNCLCVSPVASRS